MIEFVTDRVEQGNISGAFQARADQSRFRSIYGIVNGPMRGPWTGAMIENGQIHSADGKARLGGVPYTDEKGNYHDVQDGQTTYREYIVPIKDVETWNRYEAEQSNGNTAKFIENERLKAKSRGGEAELTEEEDIILEGSELGTPAQASGKPVKVVGWTPERRAKQMAKIAAKKAAKAQTNQPT